MHSLGGEVVLLIVLDGVVFYLGPRLDAVEELIHQRRNVWGCFFDFVRGLHALGLVEGVYGSVDVDVVLAKLLLELR